MSVHVYGIRHHGPGSARCLLEALTELRPDILLIEGPPEAEAVLSLAANPAMKPPVALLIYRPDEPAQASFYPFARFSPEWQAILYGLTNGLPVRFIDLPQANMLALALDAAQASQTTLPEEEPSTPLPEGAVPVSDPLAWLAKAAGVADGESWWERMVEQRRHSRDLFAGILEAMTALREALAGQDSAAQHQQALREAMMRNGIRAAVHEGFERIAVVCGAWHAPALANMPATAREDNALLKGLPRVKVRATWAPWTYSKLSWASGYGAGIASPGWYDHLWRHPENAAVQWIALAARLLRQADHIASTAQVIDAVRLAEALAALRNQPAPGLSELQEAIRATLTDGRDLPMQLIEEELIVGQVMGAVPHETPVVPLQQELTQLQKRLRLPAEDVDRLYDLDLRKPMHLQRSYLLHRLAILGIPWGRLGRAGRSKGTFHEVWQLRWRPEYVVALIEASVWGNTVASAATARAHRLAEQAPDLASLTGLVSQVLLAELPGAATYVVQRLGDLAALASETAVLMDALPPLVDVLRYGSVRQTDADAVQRVVNELVTRISIGLPGACASLDDDAAALMFGRLVRVHGAVRLHMADEQLAAWQDSLLKMVDQQSLHGLIAGRCCRLLFDGGVLQSPAAARRMNLALSLANEPASAGAWLDGFLRDSGTILLLDEKLWQVLDEWVSQLPDNMFQAILPLLRRTFATFPPAERRQLGERVRRGHPAIGRPLAPATFDHERAERALRLAARFLGLEPQVEGGEAPNE